MPEATARHTERLTTEDISLVSDKEQLLTATELGVLDEVLHELFEGLRHAAKDDRCAKVEAALIRYILDSRR